MTQYFKYRPPLKYLFGGLLGLVLASIFGFVLIESDEIWSEIGALLLFVFFFLLSSGIGISFLVLFLRKLNIGDLILGSDFIEIPGRWKNRIRLDFNDILEINEIDTYDNVIQIKSKGGIHFIERNWMKQKDFDLVKKRLKDYWMKK